MAPRARTHDVYGESKASFGDVQLFMRSFGKRHFEVLECLKQYGPSSVLDLVGLLRRNRRSIVSDVAMLTGYDLLFQIDKDHYFVPWTKLVATVQHKNYPREKNVQNMVDWYLFLFARKYDWLHVDIKFREIKRGVPKFECRLDQIYD